MASSREPFGDSLSDISVFLQELEFQNDRMLSIIASQDSPKGSSSSTCYCEICTDRKQPSDMLRINTCSHSFCSNCITRHVDTKIQERATIVLCPSGDCGVVLEFDKIGARLPPEVAARWDDMLCESVIPASDKFYCPFRNCSAMLVKDRSGEEVVIAESECPACHRLFCARCNVGWHSGIGCEEFEKLNEDEREREDLMVRELAQSNSWKRCPQCKYYVEKNEGCLHMTCRCGFQFCYACGATWSKDHGDCRPRLS